MKGIADTIKCLLEPIIAIIAGIIMLLVGLNGTTRWTEYKPLDLWSSGFLSLLIPGFMDGLYDVKTF